MKLWGSSATTPRLAKYHVSTSIRDPRAFNSGLRVIPATAKVGILLLTDLDESIS